MPSSITEEAVGVVEIQSSADSSSQDAVPLETRDKKQDPDLTITAAPASAPEFEEIDEKNPGDNEALIVTGADVSRYLLSLRDDFDPAITFRSMVIASALACFQAVVNQI